MDRGEVRRVTVAVRDLARARQLYAGMLGMGEVGEWSFDAAAIERDPDASRLARSLGLAKPAAIAAVDLEQPGTAVGAVRLICVGDVELVTRRALALGASPRCAPEAQHLQGVASFGSTVVSPDGIPLFFETATVARTTVGAGSPPEIDEAVFTPVCGLDDLKPGSVREHRPRDGSSRIALANVAGEVFACEDRCPHLGAPLSRGEMRGRSLVCPWHGWMIDVPTGRVVGGHGARVRSGSARVRDGVVEVAMPRKVES